jgi:serine/threonine protein kinase
MGQVYLARDTELQRLVAIKAVVAPAGESEEMLRREARLGAGLNHSAIATVHDFGLHEGKPFTVF